MNILIYDKGYNGHHLEYLYNLIAFIGNGENHLKRSNRYYFLVHSKLKERYSLEGYPDIEFIFTDKYAYKKKKGFVAKIFKPFQEINDIKQVVEKHSIDHVMFMFFNPYQIPLIFSWIPFSFSGISFIQYRYMQVKSLGNVVQYYYRKFSTSFVLKKSKSKNIFVLNDGDGAKQLNRYYNSDKFKYLPDPLPFHDHQEMYDLKELHKLDPQEKIYLHFGSFSERKGTSVVLDAIQLLNEKDEMESRVFVFIGRPIADYAEYMQKRVDDLVGNGAKVIFENTFIDFKYIDSIFEQSSFVLIPYKIAETSSGVLGHAAKACVPVIGVDNGLVGSLINKYKLGLALKNNSGKDLFEIIVDSDKYQHDPELGMEYIAERTPDNFSETILGHIEK